jgi:hypothetical protein
MRTPPATIESPDGTVFVANSVLGGLHHEYRLEPLAA